jgi:uncharacterized Zn-finger protein
MSDSLPIKQGVPQRSVLGPVLFTIFINDIAHNVSNSCVDMFADDITLTASSHFSDIQPLTRCLNQDLDVVQKWAQNNKMLINTKKTKSHLVTGKRIVKKLDNADGVPPLALALKGTELIDVQSHKLQGIMLDTTL